MHALFKSIKGKVFVILSVLSLGLGMTSLSAGVASAKDGGGRHHG
jgi:hypothetical protein